jgi:hypothetical protein
MLHALDAFRGRNWVLHRSHFDVAQETLPAKRSVAEESKKEVHTA